MIRILFSFLAAITLGFFFTGNIKAQTAGDVFADNCAQDFGGGDIPEDQGAVCRGTGSIGVFSVNETQFNTPLAPIDTISGVGLSRQDENLTSEIVRERSERARGAASNNSAALPVVNHWGAGVSLFATLSVTEGDRSNESVPAEFMKSREQSIPYTYSVIRSRNVGKEYRVHQFGGGAEMRLSPVWVTGAVYVHETTEVDNISDLGRSNTDFDQVSIYASYSLPNGLYGDFLGGVAQVDIATARAFGYTVNDVTSNSDQCQVFPKPPDCSANKVTFNRFARSQLDGEGIQLAFSSGWQIAKGAWRWTPSFSLDYNKISNDQSSESANIESEQFADIEQFFNSTYLLQYPKQSRENVTFSYSLEASYAGKWFGGVWMPLFALTGKTLLSQPESTQAAYLFDPTSVFVTDIPELDNQYFLLNFGVVFIFPRGVSAFGNYEQYLSHDQIEQATVSLGLRKDLNDL